MKMKTPSFKEMQIEMEKMKSKNGFP